MEHMRCPESRGTVLRKLVVEETEEILAVLKSGDSLLSFVDLIEAAHAVLKLRYQLEACCGGHPEKKLEGDR